MFLSVNKNMPRNKNDFIEARVFLIIDFVTFICIVAVEQQCGADSELPLCAYV